jgi:hypothetical protein
MPITLHDPYYIGLGAGVNFITLDQYLGEFDNPQNRVMLAGSGESGFWIPFSVYSFSSVRLGAMYRYQPLQAEGIDNLNNWGIHASLVLALY